MRTESGEPAAAGKGPTIWNRMFASVFAANALLYLGMQMVNALVPKYADSMGAAPTIVGLVSSLFALTALILKVVSGPAIDVFHRKAILMAAIAVIALSFFGFGISANVQMLFVFRLLQGCGQAFTATCCLALAADSLPKEKFGAGIGTFTLAQAVCQAIGPSISLWLAEAAGYPITFAVSGLCTLSAVAVVATIPLPFKKTKPFRMALGSVVAREAALPAVLLFFLQMAFCNVNSFIVIFAGNRNVANIGFFFTAYAAAMLFAPATIGKLADRWGAVRAMIPALISFAASFILISVSSSLPMFLLAAVLSALGYGAAQPAVQTLCMKCVHESRRGAASSTSYIGQDLGNLAGPIIAGAIAQGAGYEVMWRAMVVPMAVAMLLLLLFRSRISGIESDFRRRGAA
jgi:MFS family permease